MTEIIEIRIYELVITFSAGDTKNIDLVASTDQIAEEELADAFRIYRHAKIVQLWRSGELLKEMTR